MDKQNQNKTYDLEEKFGSFGEKIIDLVKLETRFIFAKRKLKKRDIGCDC